MTPDPTSVDGALVSIRPAVLLNCSQPVGRIYMHKYKILGWAIKNEFFSQDEKRNIGNLFLFFSEWTMRRYATVVLVTPL